MGLHPPSARLSAAFRRDRFWDLCFSSSIQQKSFRSLKSMSSMHTPMRMTCRYTVTRTRIRHHISFSVFQTALTLSRTGWRRTDYDSILPRPSYYYYYYYYHYTLELIWLGSSYHLQHAPITKEPLLISGTSILPSKQVRNLGVTLEWDLSMMAHVNKLLGTCFYHIRQLRLVRRSLDEDAAHALVRALIHSRLDYCNGVLANLTMEKFGRLQSVLKAAARLIFKFPGRTSVSELIRSRLHWLSYPDRVTYKLCVLSYKCQHGSAPVYLSRRLVPTSVIPGRAKLRSASSGLLIVPYVPSKTIGSNRSFSYCAPVAWNRLHIQSDGLTDPHISLASFKKQLKTFLFKNGDVLLHPSK